MGITPMSLTIWPLVRRSVSPSTTRLTQAVWESAACEDEKANSSRKIIGGRSSRRSSFLMALYEQRGTTFTRNKGTGIIWLHRQDVSFLSHRHFPDIFYGEGKVPDIRTGRD